MIRKQWQILIWSLGLIGALFFRIAYAFPQVDLLQTPPQTANVPVVSANELDAGLPFIRTFTYKDYQAKPQNWAIVQDLRGVIYVANTDGVLEFDGMRWRLVKIANGSTARSLALAQDGRVYVGGVGEIGYLQMNHLGTTEYVSLVDNIPKQFRDFADVWQIYTTSKGLVFSTFKRIFRLNEEGGFDTWSSNNTFHLTFTVDDRVFVREKGVGLHELSNGQLSLVPHGEMFAKERIYAMLPWLHEGKEAILIATRTQGFWLLSDGKFSHWPTTIDAQLKRDMLFPVLKLSNNKLVVGTLQGGIYVLDSQGNELIHLTTHDGLPDNAILALLTDNEGGIWVTTDNGIARVEINSPLTHFNERRGLVGVNFAVYRHLGQLYVGTAQGLFKLQPGPRARFKRVAGIKGQTWGFASADNTLLVANYYGLYAIEHNQTKRISESDAVMTVYRSKYNPKMWVLGLRSGIAILQQINGEWQESQLIKEINDEIRTIYETQPGVFWLGTKHTGVIRLSIAISEPQNLMRINKIERFGVNNGLPTTHDNWVYPVNGVPKFTTKRGIYTFNEVSGNFVLDPKFEHLFPLLRPTWSAVNDPKRGIWLYSQDPISGLAEVGLAQHQNDGHYLWQPNAFRPAISAATEGMQHIHLDKNDVVWVGSSEGLFRYNALNENSYDIQYTALIRQVSSKNRAIPTLTKKKKSLFDYDDNALRFVYAAPSFSGNDALQFSVMLEGNDTNWSQWSKEDYRDYSNLFEGSYRFKVRAKNMYGVISDEATFSFTILPPWYRTFWAYIVYGVLTLLFVKGVFSWRLKQIQAQNQLLESKIESRTKQLNFLGEIGRTITSNLDLDEALEFLYKQLNKMLDASVFGIGLYYPEQQEIEFRLAIENGQRFKPYTRDMNDKNQLAVWCITHQKPILIGDYAVEYTHYLEKIDDSSCVLSDDSLSEFPISLIYVPLMLQGRIIGLISVQSFARHAYDDSHLNIIQTLATYTAIAVDNARAHATLEEISYTDPLTHLNNRRFLLHHLKRDIALTTRKYNDWLDKKNGSPPHDADLIFFLVDIDHFKMVNDVYGHSAGDFVLIQVAKCLRMVFRESDYLIRWGGEEFLVVTRDLPRADAAKFAERIRAAMASFEFVLNSDQTINRTCSIGFCCYPFLPTHPELISWSQTVDLADDSLYMAKRSGRNAWIGLETTNKTQPDDLFHRLHQQKYEVIESGEVNICTNITTEVIYQQM